MEFATTGPGQAAGSDDSWLPRGARSFLLAPRWKILPRLDEMVEGGLITLEKVRVILYRAAKK
jgi:hypothetical protein